MDTFKVLLFNWRCWLSPAMGGAEVFTREVAKSSVKDRHRLHRIFEFPNLEKGWRYC